MRWNQFDTVVTGGAGFIGSHLVDLLVNQGANVTVLDDLSRGAYVHPGTTFEKCDLQEWSPELPGGSVVFHLAAKVTGIEYNRHNHYDMLSSNLGINTLVCDVVRQCRPRLFVFVSTACVYPHDAPVPTPESAGEVCEPEPTNRGYGLAKWVGEQAAGYLWTEHHIPTIIVRFFNAFGPRDYYDEETSHVAPALIKRVLDGENPVVVWGTGSQSRALVDARDIALALSWIAEAGIDLFSEVLQVGNPPAFVGVPVFNIGHQREITIRELAETIVRLSGRDGVDLVFDTTKPDGYPRRAADTTRLSQLLGWVPDTPLEITLTDMIEDYRSRYQVGG